MIIGLRLIVIAELIFDRPLRREDRPVRLLRRMGLGQDSFGLPQMAGFCQRLAIGAQHLHVLGIFGREPLCDRHRLIVALAGAKRAGIGHRDALVIRLRIVALAEIFGIALQLRRRIRRDGIADRSSR